MEITLKFEHALRSIYCASNSDSAGMYEPLHFWIEEVFRKTDYSGELSFLNDENHLACSYNTTVLTKESNYIIIGDLFDDNDVDKVYMPKQKFSQLLELLEKNAYLTTERYRPQQIFFTFDDEWNCTITWKLP